MENINKSMSKNIYSIISLNLKCIKPTKTISIITIEHTPLLRTKN